MKFFLIKYMLFLDNNYSFLPNYIDKLSTGAFYGSKGFNIINSADMSFKIN